MTAYTVPVAPGNSPTQLMGAPLSADSMIRNTNSTYAVWVSDKPTVGINRGQRIPPLGRITWSGSSTGGALWAICDTGTVGNIELTISDNASDLSDPVGEGVAVATAVASIGVPNTIFGAVIAQLQGILSGNQITYDVSRYSVLNLYLSPFNAGVGPVALYAVFYADANRTVVVGDGTMIGLPHSDARGGITLPVLGPYVALYAFLGTVQVSMYGSNRIAEDLHYWNPDGAGTFRRTATWVANVSQTLPNLATNRSVLLTRGGMATVRINTASGGGYWGFRYVNSSGTIQEVYPIEAATATVDLVRQVALPAGMVTPCFLPVSAGTYTVDSQLSIGGL